MEQREAEEQKRAEEQREAEERDAPTAEIIAAGPKVQQQQQQEEEEEDDDEEEEEKEEKQILVALSSTTAEGHTEAVPTRAKIVESIMQALDFGAESCSEGEEEAAEGEEEAAEGEEAGAEGEEAGAEGGEAGAEGGEAGAEGREAGASGEGDSPRASAREDLLERRQQQQHLFERQASPRRSTATPFVPPLSTALGAKRILGAPLSKPAGRVLEVETDARHASTDACTSRDREQDASTDGAPLEQRLESKLEEQRASLEEAALEAVNSMLAHLQMPTLQQALEDLGLPATGGKGELTARLTDRLTSGFTPRRVSGRRE